MCSPLLAQTISGTISGTVSDSSGAVVPNAAVTITNTDQNAVVFNAKSNSVGQYTAPFLME
ncbi:carboxypeptidase-like regulatory domain-containing protein [Alloacidobacterium sp.]|uniref:carboxypeptidase-like regulatory domain-containing protein n=1 Tax=Alloacidobacterium sp. TaxID=2951999 RepID=UPI002D57EDF4|nr:carboxypeptidase-like regulatory domain-containing protein [Alloacidobacterium sp.]HYK36494.1 carboxypeptidase-like regulatory domain-containing protein [Alloacidobacterium sp.]